MYSYISFIGSPVHPLYTLSCSTYGCVCVCVFMCYLSDFMPDFLSPTDLPQCDSTFDKVHLLSRFTFCHFANDPGLNERKRGQRQEESWVNLLSEIFQVKMTDFLRT